MKHDNEHPTDTPWSEMRTRESYSGIGDRNVYIRDISRYIVCRPSRITFVGCETSNARLFWTLNTWQLGVDEEEEDTDNVGTITKNGQILVTPVSIVGTKRWRNDYWCFPHDTPMTQVMRSEEKSYSVSICLLLPAWQQPPLISVVKCICSLTPKYLYTQLSMFSSGDMRLCVIMFGCMSALQWMDPCV